MAGAAPVTYRVVIAEDNAQIRDLLRQQLAELGHAVIAEACNGIDVVALVERERPDVVVIDWGLPGQDGLVATAAIQRKAPAPVILLSANVSSDDPEMQARHAGAHAFLAKPYLIEELDEALEQAVTRYRKYRPHLALGAGADT